MNNLNNNICYLQGLGILFFLSSVMACDPTPHLQKSQPTQPSTALDSEQGMGGIVAEDTSRKWLTFMLQEFKEGKISIHASHPGDNSGGTLLHYAACLGENKIVEDLLAQGANPNIEDTNKITPLQLLFIFQVMNPHLVEKQLEVVNTLLAQPVIEINKKELSGNTALHYATSTGCLFTLNALLDHQRIDLNAQNKEGQTPLHFAAQRGHVEIVERLLEKSVDINAQDQYGFSALHEAARYGHTTTVDLLLKRLDIKFDEPDKIGRTPLYFAAHRGHVEIVKGFLEKSVNINARNELSGLRPLHLAVMQGHVEIVKILLQYDGVNPNLPDKKGNTPVDQAFESNVAILEILLTHPGINANVNYKEQPLCHALLEKGHHDILATFLSHANNLDVNLTDSQGLTLLYLAVTKNLSDIVNILLTYKGIDVNQGMAYTPLYVAANKGYLKIVEALLHHPGIQFDLRSAQTTPFEIARLQLNSCKTHDERAKYQAIMAALTVKADEVYEKNRLLPSPYNRL